MIDLMGRKIDYMRISITDRCNLRCKYCMPEDVKWIPMGCILTYEEIETVCKIASELGIKKIKITGGEPLVRRDASELVAMIKKIDDIENVTMTTNGALLGKYAATLKEKGLDAVNVSLDTLDEDEFIEITNRAELSSVIDGIKKAKAAGLRVKINTVLRPELSKSMIQKLVAFANEQEVEIRFIEMMPIGSGKGKLGMSNDEVIEFLASHYGKETPDPSIHGNGPALYYSFPKLKISVGAISAMHGKFCASCNRIRMTSTGQLKACLCYSSTIDIKKPLRTGNLSLVKQLLRECMFYKPKEHCFEKKEEITEQLKMSSIGG